MIAEAYNAGARAGLAELGALHDNDARRIAESTPNGRAVDHLAHETVDRVTTTHRGILRGVEDGYRQVVAEVSATPCSASTPAAKRPNTPWGGLPTVDCGCSSTRAGGRGR
ncbi:hypothetical protein [Streptomyces yunnanensis]|uniref:hypothetical protein n=1 Tax=Streptomyces yunnanensis TaxID=156453 RepID=UPI00257089F6|nr:hypothetical protein [Streptomyces yunnanensis]